MRARKRRRGILKNRRRKGKRRRNKRRKKKNPPKKSRKEKAKAKMEGNPNRDHFDTFIHHFLNIPTNRPIEEV